MKIVFINPDYRTYGDPPLGLAYLAAYIRQKLNFVDVKILDQVSSKEMIRRLEKDKPDIIGLTAVSHNFYNVKKLGRLIKSHFPNTLLIIGGVHVTISPGSFKDSPFDLAVRGEGEMTATKLLENINECGGKLNIEKLSKIPGLILRDGEQVIDTGLSEQIKDLDELPMPARDLLNMKYYSLPRFSSENINPIGAIITSRGCPFSCRFCSSSSFWRGRIRFFSAKRVVDEMELLYKKYGYDTIFIYDDLFAVNKERLREIVRLMEERNLLGKIKLDCLGRANCFDDETAKLLKKMGNRCVSFGIETGSQKMLTYLKGPGITIENGKNAFRIARENGLVPFGFFMIGSPTETMEDMKQTYDFIKENCPGDYIAYQTMAYPATELWRYALENKIMKEDFWDNAIEREDYIDVRPDLLLTKEVTPEEFMDIFNKIRGIYSKESKSVVLKNILSLRPKHLRLILNKEFIKKAYHMRKQFIKRIF